ncbi:MAG: bifunctional proline dehydrogenase/L-glutamate gamma-semialdehyde dehydrogenase [Planctomycetota bacterium]
MIASTNTAAWAGLPPDISERAVKLAAELLRASRARETSAERAHSAQMARMMQDEAGKKFTIIMTDQILKIEQPDRAAQRLQGLVDRFGYPKFLKGWDRTKLWAGNLAASLAPGFVMPQINQQVRKQSSNVIISAETAKFANYFRQRSAQGFRVNFNQLGEAVLGDHEADRRWKFYLDKLSDSEVTYVSVKLSSIVSQISMTGYRQTLETIKQRLREVYRAAQKNRSGQAKFVNLDMEEYRDLHMTVDVFREVLDEPEFEKYEAGIVLQAYLPDSYAVQQELTEWARQRHARTGAGIKIRLVKGANLAMEQVEAALRGWPQAPYHDKPAVDANFKRMLEFGSRPENAAVVRLGVASHNLFDVAHTMLVREARGVGDRVEFEMLEGMANAQALEVTSRVGGLTIYTPAVLDHEFEAAVAYLVRRLDENTAPGSFLGALFGLEEGSPAWNAQKEAFLKACKLARDPQLQAKPNRTQNRLTERPEAKHADEPFDNEPDTDFALPANRQWAAEIIERWKSKQIAPLELWIGNAKQTRELTGKGKDPSRPGVVAYQYAEANPQDVDSALRVAVEAQPGWEKLGIAGRAKVLREVAAEFARQRGETIGAMVLDAGKAIGEGDVEVSEAIDFANYYAQSLDEPGWLDGSRMRARGVVVVTPPWNFPYAIPAGGCLAALMAGNTVILKPSRESVLTAWMLASQFWAAGVPREVLQFLPIGDRAAGKALVTDSRTAAVILTGSFDTARNFQSWRPDLPLFAETSGKNAMIVTVNADVDLAIKDMVRGAFGHSGQKCSATSLALVEKSIYQSEKFRQQLKDAARSLIAGGSWNASAIATPVIREPDENLRRGLTQLDPGEEWLLEPRMLENNPCLWSPGIKLGVKPGSWYHRTECFGPVLGLICVESFEEALRIQNSNEFGLTGGLHSLDPKEIATWREKVEVGNAYINRGMTGAIVRRQPFGGWKHSCVGPGAKAGGPNYVATLAQWEPQGLPRLGNNPSPDLVGEFSKWERIVTSPADQEALAASASSYGHWWKTHFSLEHDPSQVHGETNHFRYRPRPWHILRLSHLQDPRVPLAVAQVALACKVCRVPLSLSLPRSATSGAPSWWSELGSGFGLDIREESHTEFCQRLGSMRDGTVRVLEPRAGEVFAPAEIGNIHVFAGLPLANGRLELLSYLREQSISQTIHRYGNVLE